MERYWFALLTVSFLTSCTSEASVPVRGDEPIQTDQLTYFAEVDRRDPRRPSYSFHVHVTVRNRSTSTIYLARCSPSDRTPIYRLQRESQGDSLDTAYNRAWACTGHDQPIVLPPVEARFMILHFQGPNLWEGRTGEPHGVPTGIHRLYFEAGTCPEVFSCRLPEDAVHSNAFSVLLG